MNDNMMMTEYEFFLATGLYEKARNRFEDLGFITPRYRGFERFYSQEDAQLVTTILSLLDGTIDLVTAHRMATGSLYEQAA